MDKFDLVYKKYKDLPIDRTIFMFLIVTVLREKKMHMLDSNISEDITFMNEMDKEITIYLKNQIEYYNDIDSEIYLIEKYKNVFLLPKINEINFSTVEKERIIIDALKENKQKVNLKKLRKILLSQEEILEEKENIDVLYKYFIDIEDLINNKELTGKEKLIIILKFGYIKSHFCSKELISEILNIDIDEVEKVYNQNQKKLQKIFDYDLEEHHLNK